MSGSIDRHTHLPNDEACDFSGSSLARWRQIYELAKAGAEGFDFSQIPPEVLASFQAEPAEIVEDKD